MTSSEAPLIISKKKRPSMPVVNAGTTLLMAVLLVLVLVVLALLTLSSARNDLAFSRQMAEKSTQYYTACNEAEQMLSQVDYALRQAREQNTAPDFSGLDVDVFADRVSWSVPVNEGQALWVEVPFSTGQVSRWQVISLQPWEGDSYLTTLQP